MTDPTQVAGALAPANSPAPPGLETLFSALDKMAPPEPAEPADGLEPGAREALAQQNSWEEKILGEHEQMRLGNVIALPSDNELDKLRLLRGMDALQARDFPPEQQKAVAQHLKDVVDRLAGQPILKRGSGHLTYR